SLQELDLSMNPLGDDGARALSEFLERCPALTTLRLQGCGITEPFPIPEASLLRTLSLSCNVLGPEGLRRLLRTIPAHSIRSLELASVIGRQRDTGDTGDIGRDLGHYLQQVLNWFGLVSSGLNCFGLVWTGLNIKLGAAGASRAEQRRAEPNLSRTRPNETDPTRIRPGRSRKDPKTTREKSKRPERT
ncbi:hypothetical protein HGM15179_019274, partial [Zosterops borbonicus]